MDVFSDSTVLALSKYAIILKWILEIQDGVVWTDSDLAQDRDQWRALVKTAMNLRFSQNAGKFLSSCVTDGF
jgi:hypothetical protein